MLAFDPLTSQDAPTLAIAFTNRIAGRTPASCSVSVTIFETSNASDPDPDATLNGPSALSTLPMTIDNVVVAAGQAVEQPILAGRVTGATYVYRFVMTYADGSADVVDAVQTINEYSN